MNFFDTCSFLNTIGIYMNTIELAGGRHWSSLWGCLRLKHPSTPVHLWIRGAQSQDYVLSVHCVCVIFTVTFTVVYLHYQVSCSSLKAFL